MEGLHCRFMVLMPIYIQHSLERMHLVCSKRSSIARSFINNFSCRFFIFPQILSAQITDIGRYVCVAENIAGSAKKYFNLNAHGKTSVPQTSVRLLVTKQGNQALESAAWVLFLTWSVCEAYIHSISSAFPPTKVRSNCRVQIFWAHFCSIFILRRKQLGQCMWKAACSCEGWVSGGPSAHRRVYSCSCLQCRGPLTAVCSVKKRRPPCRVK